MSAEGQSGSEQVERDLAELRARKGTLRPGNVSRLQLMLSRVRAALERHPAGSFLVNHAWLPFLILSVLAAWGIQEARALRGVGGDASLALRSYSSLGTLALIVILVRMRRSQLRYEARPVQAGLSAGAAIGALVPAVVSAGLLCFVALVFVLLVLPDPVDRVSSVRPAEVVKALVRGLAWWAPLGVLAACSRDARISFAALRQRVLGWRDYAAFAAGLAFAVPAALAPMRGHFRVLRFFLYGSD
jgi:hypothetical protein